MAWFSGISLFREFEPDDQRLENPSESEVDEVLESMGRVSASDMLNCGACGYEIPAGTMPGQW
ncbi:MAG: hypothetical protein R2744_03085 [Bacteroidales bacterium]